MARKKRDELVFLQDILDCIDRIETYLEGVTEDEFENNFEKQDSVLRRIEIMGEAVKKYLHRNAAEISRSALAGFCRNARYSNSSVFWRLLGDSLANCDYRDTRIQRRNNGDSQRLKRRHLARRSLPRELCGVSKTAYRRQTAAWWLAPRRSAPFVTARNSNSAIPYGIPSALQSESGQ